MTFIDSLYRLLGLTLHGDYVQDGLLRYAFFGSEGRPSYMFHHSAHALHIPLGQFKVSFDRLRVEIDHQFDQSNRVCQLYHLHEVKTKEHFIF